jgi:DNA polymerase III delta subunit
MIIIHGENTIQSRQKLIEIITQAKAQLTLVEHLQASELTLPQLESKLQKTDLFGHNRLIVIEELHSLPTSTKKKNLIELLTSANMEICLWEKRTLTPTMLKKFEGATFYEFKIANSLFNWLDSLSPNSSTITKQLRLLHQAFKDNDEYLCFIMLARQIRLLIQAKSGGQVTGPYFVVNKIKKQAQIFTLKQLFHIHSVLFLLDQHVKSSANSLSIRQTIEQLIIDF